MALSIVQNTAVHSQASGGTNVKAFAGALTDGSLLVAVVTYESDTTTVACADGTNGSYGTAAAEVTQGAFSHTAIFTKVNSGTATPTVTATFTGTPGPSTLKLYEITGQNATPIDASATLSTADNTPPTLDLTTTVANDIIILGVTGYANGYTVDAGFTAAFTEYGGSNGYHWGEYIADAGATSTRNLRWGLVGIGKHYAGAAIAIKVASTGGFLSRNFWWDNL